MLRRLALLAILPLLLALLLPAPCFAADPPLDPDIDEGHRLFAHEKYDEALKHYLKALERNEEDAYLHFRIGLTYFVTGNNTSAGNQLNIALSLNENVGSGIEFGIYDDAMRPTLLAGDSVFIDRTHYDYHEMKINDIILFQSPIDENEKFVRRIIGVQGDTIKVKNKILFKNGYEIENMCKTCKLKHDEYYNIKPFKLIKGEYFVSGDNLYDSYDSRFFGPINKRDILGRVLVIFYSSKNINGVEVERTDRFGVHVK